MRDRYTARLVLRSPFVWLGRIIASAMTLPIVARECVESFGDLRRPEAVVGTGPWMLDTYRRGVGITLIRHPDYFRKGLPYIDRVELTLDDDNTRVMGAFIAGHYDIGWKYGGMISRSDWLQIRETVKVRRPRTKQIDLLDSAVPVIYMRTDRPPFNDVRVRRAISMAIDRRELIDVVMDGAGVINPPLAAAMAEWALPIDQPGEGARNYEFDPRTAGRLLAEAGYPQGLETVMNFVSYGSRPYLDTLQLLVRYLDAVGIRVKLVGKEYGAFAVTVSLGQFEATGLGVLPPAVTPYGPLYLRYHPGEVPNAAHVDDPVLTAIS